MGYASGEMEVWALEAYGARAHPEEPFTAVVRTTSMAARSDLQAIVKGEPVIELRRA